MVLPRNSRPNVGRFSCFQSVTREMPALQGQPPLPRRLTWHGQLWPTRPMNLPCTRTPRWGIHPHAWAPFLTNSWYGEEVPKDRRGNPLPPVPACYQEFSRAVDGANLMALQMRQLGRQMTWSHALRAFMVRYAVASAFATAKALGLVDEKTTMWEFQWDILQLRYFSGAEFNNTTPTAAVPTVHAPKPFASRLLCTHCRNGSTRWASGACRKHMHIKCFGDAHDV